MIFGIGRKPEERLGILAGDELANTPQEYCHPDYDGTLEAALATASIHRELLKSDNHITVEGVKVENSSYITIIAFIARRGYASYYSYINYGTSADLWNNEHPQPRA